MDLQWRTTFMLHCQVLELESQRQTTEKTNKALHFIHTVKYASLEFCPTSLKII